jgi:alkanesulfonate monooxygenase SsuD/methylene tetrahydromethanopterin reductase-like flavin-dependent oxidoreductase (luciferase family)
VNNTFGPIERMGTTTPKVLVAALGPIMLKLAGRMTDGTATWMTGAATLEGHIIPTISDAAKEAGRDAPMIVAGVPVAITSDVEKAKETVNAALQIYGTLPSYRAMLDKEGAAGPADVAILGDEATVRAGIQRYADVGVTDFQAAIVGNPQESAETRELLKSL